MRNFTAVTVIFPVIKQMKLRASVTLKKKSPFSPGWWLQFTSDPAHLSSTPTLFRIKLNYNNLNLRDTRLLLKNIYFNYFSLPEHRSRQTHEFLGLFMPQVE